jgi:hypothetical protein
MNLQNAGEMSFEEFERHYEETKRSAQRIQLGPNGTTEIHVERP